MRDDLLQASAIAAVGVVVVMVVLTILMLAIMMMTRLTSVRNQKERRDMGIHGGFGEDGPREEDVAAIAVAVALAMEQQKAGRICQDDKASVSQPKTGRWPAAGKERLMSSRQEAGRRWGRRQG